MKPRKSVFILAAGKGERLRPLTNNTPKPLLQVKGKKILEHLFDRLKIYGADRIVLNAWYLKEQIVDFAAQQKGRWPFEILVSEEDELLGTGGGLKKALPLIDTSCFLMMNGDCLWEGDLEWFCERSRKASFDASWWMASESSDQTSIGLSDGRVVSIGDLWSVSDPAQTRGCFSGIQWIQRIRAEDLPDKGCLIRNYLIPALKAGKVSLGAVSEGLVSWSDLGTPERFNAAQE